MVSSWKSSSLLLGLSSESIEVSWFKIVSKVSDGTGTGNSGPYVLVVYQKVNLSKLALICFYYYNHKY
jgi:hypothetical protein